MRSAFLFASVFFALVLAAAAPAAENSSPADLAWQTAISGQIEAFRHGDSVGALGFAGALFQKNYDDPEAFAADIRRMGYGALIDSRDHSFGTFERNGETHVRQVVHVTGPDLTLYDALYQMDEEDTGWRVAGVILVKRPGVGV